MKKIGFLFLFCPLFSSANSFSCEVPPLFQDHKWKLSFVCAGIGFLYYQCKVSRLTKEKKVLDGVLSNEIKKNLEWEQRYSKLLDRLKKSGVIVTRTGLDYTITNQWKLLHESLLQNLSQKKVTTLWVENENNWSITCNQEEELLQQIQELSQELSVWQQHAATEKNYALLHSLWDVTQSLELDPECRAYYSDQEINEIMQCMRFKPKNTFSGTSRRMFEKDKIAHPFPKIKVSDPIARS